MRCFFRKQLYFVFYFCFAPPHPSNAYAFDTCLACGLGHGAALTIHRMVIHSRAAATLPQRGRHGCDVCVAYQSYGFAQSAMFCGAKLAELRRKPQSLYRDVCVALSKFCQRTICDVCVATQRKLDRVALATLNSTELRQRLNSYLSFPRKKSASIPGPTCAPETGSCWQMVTV